MSTTRHPKYPNHSCIDVNLQPTGLFCHQCEKPPEELLPEQSAEWRVSTVKQDVRVSGMKVDATEIYATDSADWLAQVLRSHHAEQIVRDHRLAALVPGLLAGLEAALAVGVTGPALRQRLENEVKQARAALTAVTKERAGASDDDTKRFYSDKANRGYGPHSDQD